MIYKKIYSFLFFLLICLCIKINYAAAENLSGLNIDCKSTELDLSGMYWKVYKVADISDNDYTTLSGYFTGLPVKIDFSSDEAIYTTASTLEVYAEAKNIPPDYMEITKSDGVVTIDELKKGCYLIIAEPMMYNKGEYLSAPSLIRIYDNNPDGYYKIIPKLKFIDEKEYNSNADRTVKKVWQQAEKTSEITVQLFCDGKIYDEAVLNEENNWQHTWKNLENRHHWIVIEETVPEGCIVSYTNYKTDCSYELMIVNTGNIPYDNSENEENSDCKLPQTGQLWWPVPILSGAGIVFFVAGWVVYKKI